MPAEDGATGEGARWCAPGAGLHAVDRLVLGGLAVPDGLAPLDASAARWVPSLVMDAAHLPPGERRRLLEYAGSLPQEERRSSFAEHPADPGAGPGGRLIRMCRYRNLSLTGLARTLAVLTPSYLSASTYGMIGAGRKELTPRLVTDFAALLGIDVRELAALTGTTPPGTPRPPSPETEDAAALLWEARRLSASQARHLAGLAESLRGDARTGYRLDLPGEAGR